MATSGASMPFIKNLASSDLKIRTKALNSLRDFLSAKYAGRVPAPLTFRDAQKLWAGLFYALWMTDRARAQQRLCADLAGLLDQTALPDASRAVWLRAFWATMARQWTTGIDVLRMDKFMLLVRRVLEEQLAWMGRAEDDGASYGRAGKSRKAAAATTAATELGLAVLAEFPLNPDAEAPIKEEEDDEEQDADEDGDKDEEDPRPKKRSKRAAPTLHIPVGLTLHVLDIWVDEADKLGLLSMEPSGFDGASEDEADDENEEDSGTKTEGGIARRINALVVDLEARTTAPAIRKRAREALADERLPWNPKSTGGGIEQQGGDDDEENEDGDWAGFND